MALTPDPQSGAVAMVVDGAIATVRFDRVDKRNAISCSMMEQIIAALDHLAGLDTVKAVIIEGAGGVFSAGWDRAELLDRSEPHWSHFVEVALAFYRSLIGFPKALIASVESYALGTAFDVALLSDVRVCSQGTVFGHPEVKAGGPCLYTPLKEVVGAGWARELCLSGRSIDAATAERIGFVNRVSIDGGARATAIELAKEICDVPLETIVYTKSFLLTAPPAEEWLPAELDRVMRNALVIQR